MNKEKVERIYLQSMAGLAIILVIVVVLIGGYKAILAILAGIFLTALFVSGFLWIENWWEEQ